MRYFKLIYVDNNHLYECGRYSGKTHTQAAFKAFSRLAGKIRDDNDYKTFVFCMRDCTSEGEYVGTKYIYHGIRKKLKEPKHIVIHKGLPDEKTIIYEHEN